MLSLALDRLLSLLCPPCGARKAQSKDILHGLRFVDVIYDDWQGYARPVGIVHEMKFADGHKREVFTFCCKGERQPEMALFVKQRHGNSVNDLLLCHEEQERIPLFLRSLPSEYLDAHISAHRTERLVMAG